METSPIISTAPNTAVAQVHWQSLLWREGGDVIERRMWNAKRAIHKSYAVYKEVGFSLFSLRVKEMYRMNLCVVSLSLEVNAV